MQQAVLIRGGAPLDGGEADGTGGRPGQNLAEGDMRDPPRAERRGKRRGDLTGD